jgi:hypothetical protein
LDLEQESVVSVGCPDVAVSGCEAEGSAGQLELADNVGGGRVDAAEEVAEAGAVPERSGSERERVGLTACV